MLSSLTTSEPPVRARLSTDRLVELQREMGAEDFIRCADQAMYESKKRRDGSIVFR